jgi:hypothetical protein
MKSKPRGQIYRDVARRGVDSLLGGEDQGIGVYPHRVRQSLVEGTVTQDADVGGMEIE